MCQISNSMVRKMRAWQIYNYGDLNDLRLTRSYKIPMISNPQQVLVKVEAASINPIDLEIINGYGSSVFDIIRKFKHLSEFPKTLGRDFSGTVLKIGQSVNFFKPGMQVIGSLWPFEDGSHADVLVCNQNQLALKPRKLNFTDAAALPYAGLTAYSALIEHGGLKVGNASSKRILILGASGGVGTLALQVAKAFGSYVAVTCRENSEDFLMELGADSIHDDDFSSINTTYDMILDCVGDNFESYISYLKPDSLSRYITIKHSLIALSDKYSPYLGIPLAGFGMSKKFFKNFVCNRSIIYQWGFFRPSGYNLSILSNFIDRDLIAPVVHALYDFEDILKAYNCLKAGKVKGKIVLRMNSNIDY